MKNTKTKLISSVAVLLICFAMLIGSTFAWFTDSASTGVNKIQAGNLDVQLLAYDGSDYKDVNEIPNSPLPLFGSGETANGNNHKTLWEPGKTQVAFLRIENKGNLALKYQVEVQVVNPSDSNNLYQALSYVVVPDATTENGDPSFTWNEISANKRTVDVGTNIAATDVPMQPNDIHNFALAVHMNEEAGNDYKNGKVEFYIKVLATQLNSESDSFGTDYDVNALYPSIAMGTVVSGKETILSSSGVSAKIPADEIADGTNVTIEAIKTTPPANLSVPEGLSTVAYEITLKDANGNSLSTNPSNPVEVSLKVGTGLTGVRFYHNDQEVNDFTYNEATGELKFETSTFSPFTVATGTAIYHVDSSNIQEYLDGAHGSISNARLVLAEGNYDKIDLARATKYPGSNTDYYIGGISESNKKTFDDFVSIKKAEGWSGYPWYIRNIENLTLVAEQNAIVTINGIVCNSGHNYQDSYDYVLEHDVTSSNNGYYKAINLLNIRFEGLTFSSNIHVESSLEQTVIDGLTFERCNFDINNITTTASSETQELRVYNGNNNGKIRNVNIYNSNFSNCCQGIYTGNINGLTVENCNFSNTGHNAIAVQTTVDSQGNPFIVNHKAIVIKRNRFKNIGDRIIRFGKVGADTQITIQNNTAENSGKYNSTDGYYEVIKAETLEQGIKLNISDNEWGNNHKAYNEGLRDLEG